MGLADLPSGSGEAHAKAFEKFGWERKRTTSGGNPHIILGKAGERANLSIPNHKGKDVKRVLIAKLLKLANIDEADYIAAFKRRK